MICDLSQTTDALRSVIDALECTTSVPDLICCTQLRNIGESVEYVIIHNTTDYLFLFHINAYMINTQASNLLCICINMIYRENEDGEGWRDRGREGDIAIHIIIYAYIAGRIVLATSMQLACKGRRTQTNDKLVSVWIMAGCWINDKPLS